MKWIFLKKQFNWPKPVFSAHKLHDKIESMFSRSIGLNICKANLNHLSGIHAIVS